MGIDFQPDRPIYQQLIDRLAGEIIREKRKPGDKLPSVREYAVETGVNANTIQRVYREMEQMEIVQSKRGQGTFVTENRDRLHELREQMKQTYIEYFVKDMSDLGFTISEMTEGLAEHEAKKGEKE
ncbi:GntR family transcriptional regulator [Halobacillus locisalis]|uniref:GntR family transcriptional regulator n=1 Tax=Halobacillus locisalis TaxID=220753 RepID=A0A838CVD8_9BACI|nr:GntR family transcriptional regulator [Halobacillus locisalis]MBA2175873.1 GntR family transcriptional regulator [Halobacillus locisalis]